MFLPRKCENAITIIAMPAGIASAAQIMVIKIFSVLALSVHALTATIRVLARMPTPARMANNPATGFFLIGYAGAVLRSNRLIMKQTKNNPTAMPMTT